MNLDEAQRGKVAQWIAEGCKLSEIQNRLATELGVKLTYMEARLLVDDLKLLPRDVEPAKPVTNVLNTQPEAAANPLQQPPDAQPSGKVSVTVDQLARPGALASGKVKFSDGQSAEWYFDQTGRLGLVPPQPGYRPMPADLQEFQMALEQELSRMGL